MRGVVSLLPVAVLFAFATSCSDEELPNLPDANPLADAGPVDLGLPPDASEPADATTPQDAAETDAAAPDAEIADAPAADATPADAAAPDATADAGVVIPDQDGDGISDGDEGDGLVDTDGDGTPDSADADSDNDGIPDQIEAGDADPATPPVDTDTDGTPDFRDADSDNDGISDQIEGSVDTDTDGIGDFRDTDSDADGISDQVEGNVDTDTDTTPNFRDTDSDNDGISDLIEGAGDPDGDTTPNYLDGDSDGDGITDQVEGSVDTDNDQTRDFLDTDSDADGISDQVEGTNDPDGDQAPNYRDTDSDGDTVRDDHEGSGDADNDATPNYLDLDADGDTINDSVEAGDANPLTPPIDHDFDRTPDFLDLDSDDDLISDRHEGTADTDLDGLIDRLDIDSDNDGILDDTEAGDTNLTTAPINTDNDASADFRDTDSDNDTILDTTETTLDRDGDRRPNYRDTDADGDGVLDSAEAGDNNPSTPPVNSDNDNVADYLDTDSDNDGLADGTEPGCPAGPNRLRPDTDNDGFLDPAEVAYGSNPCNAGSIIDDFYFVLPPLDPEQRAPLTFSNTEIDRADLAINMDTTGSMGGEIANLRTSLSTLIIPSVGAVIPDAAFGVSSFEDYPILPFGQPTASDIPFRLGTRVTTNAATAQAAVNALVTRDGFDLAESGIEALYQVATGAGTTWPGGNVPAFNPATGLVPGVADGTIGGVGFRDNSLPIIVQVTDATSHQRQEYLDINNQIGAVTTQVARNAIDGIGARIVGIANARLPHDPYTPICTHATPRILGLITSPFGSDVDWFLLSGAVAGQTVTVETTAIRAAGGLDTYVGVFNATAEIANNDDIGGGVIDSRVTTTLSGTGPFYVAVTSWADTDFNGSDGQSYAHYFLDVSVNGTPWTTAITQCRTDDANTRTNATRLVPFASSAGPANVSQCITTCQQVLEPMTLPYGMAIRTGAVVPPCAWDLFGTSRPAGCAANQCCTGLNGTGLAVNNTGQCALSFQIDDGGAGLSNALVAGIEALVRFSTFTITTVVRPDPAQLALGFDTTCFVHGVVPVSATPPNACAPTPVPADLVPPAGQNDSFQNVVPGTVLSFDVIAQNENVANGTACRPLQPDPQLYRAFIDVVADGVTVVDTRDVIIIVPPAPPTGSN